MSLFDCVWVTLGVLANQKPSEIDTSLQIVQPRPQPGTEGVSMYTIADLLRALEDPSSTVSTHIFPAYSDNVEGTAHALAQGQGTKKVGVLYTRQDGSQHCVVYQYTKDPRPQRAGMRHLVAHTYDSGRWEFVDYQGNPKGVIVREDVEKAAEVNGLFAVAPSSGDWSARYGRRPLDVDIRTQERQNRREADVKARKARREAELRQRRGIDDMMYLDDVEDEAEEEL